MNTLKYVLSFFNTDVRNAFDNFDIQIIKNISEIRIRRNKPVAVVIGNTTYFINKYGDIFNTIPENPIIMADEDFDDLFIKLCGYCVYNNTNTLMNGYITLENGARVGVALSAVYENGNMISVKDPVSLNIRIPREVKGCSSAVIRRIYSDKTPSIIVAGKPNSGKTTFLRDAARLLSDGFSGKSNKVTVIDERNELAAKQGSAFSLNVGNNSDVLTFFEKSKAIDIATRVLSPEIIICDEISTKKEVNSILQSFASGIKFALSVHCDGYYDLIHRNIVKMLLSSGEFSYIILLDNYTYKAEILNADEVYDEIFCNGGDSNFLHGIGNQRCGFDKA